MLYLRREKDEETLLDFITTSFVFPDTETENEVEKEELDVGTESSDAEDAEEVDEEEEKEFVAKVSANPPQSSMLTGGGICMKWPQLSAKSA